ncbi:hypothetical protein KEM52_000530 [Ascosphaera acerosa]|nr:hypothetical protein KEM52_000530 [Ascosphaera acerosa]
MAQPSLLARRAIAGIGMRAVPATPAAAAATACARCAVAAATPLTTVATATATAIAAPGPDARRAFSHARPARASMQGQVLRQRAPPSPSMKTSMRQSLQQMTRDQFHDDMGLLPATFVRPVWAHLPSLFREPRGRLQMEWQWLKSRVRNAMMEMYTAFANADKKTLERICCAGLRNDFNKRISKRPSAAPYTWTLHGYISFPRSLAVGGGTIVSDRATIVPMIKKSAIRQVVVRIQSRQSLEKPARGAGAATAAATAAADKKIQDCVEYLVLQKCMFKGVEDAEWKVWGLASETDLETLKKDPFFGPGVPIKEQLSSLTGGAF